MCRACLVCSFICIFVQRTLFGFISIRDNKYLTTTLVWSTSAVKGALVSTYGVIGFIGTQIIFTSNYLQMVHLFVLCITTRRITFIAISRYCVLMVKKNETHYG